MRYLCLIHLDEEQLAAMTEPEMSALNAHHVALNQDLQRHRTLVEAEALEPARATTCVQVRNGATRVTDGPYTEAKEVVAGFYLIEAPDLDAAVAIAARIPAAELGTVEVRPTRRLLVDGCEVW